jgi:TldD protein
MIHDALLQEALSVARAAGASYADARFVDTSREDLRVRGIVPRGPEPEAIERKTSSGFGVRVLYDGAWGFACTPTPTAEAISRAAREAVAIAKATSRVIKKRVVLAPVEPQRGVYKTKLRIDPFTVPLDDKLRDLIEPVELLLRGGAPVRTATSSMSWVRVHKALITSEGTAVEQDLTYGGAELNVVAVGQDGRAQTRSYPSSHGGDTGQGGYERLSELRLRDHAGRLREEVTELLTAPPLPAGKRTIILDSSQVALQVHESCGHPTELDRALGTEISLAGGSFLQPSMLEHFRYGSEHVNLVADAQAEGGLGTFGWDDEGIPAQTIDLVRNGLFTGYLSSRETASEIGRTSSGSMRADGWNRLPLIRMVNVSLLPGKAGSLEDLIADTDDGVLLEINRAWSIDDLRLHFQFGCELAREIKNGKRGRVFRNPIYQGVTPEFWRRCDAVCGEQDWRLWGVVNCGKGDPIQVMQVGHGAAPARFHDVEVGSS